MSLSNLNIKHSAYCLECTEIMNDVLQYLVIWKILNVRAMSLVVNLENLKYKNS